MPSERFTLLDLAKRNGTDLSVGLIEENLVYSPELSVAAVRTIPGTSTKLSVRIADPVTGFRNVNSGIAPSKSQFRLELVQLQVLAGRTECDTAIADAHEAGRGDYLFNEASGVLRSAWATLARQFYYGEHADAGGPPGLLQQYDPAVMEVDAEGTTDTTSVWLVRFDPRACCFIFGRDTPLVVGDPREESLTDSDGRRFPGLVQDLSAWSGVQVGSKDTVCRIKNIGTGASALDDDMIFRAIQKFPAGAGPDVIFMSKRSLAQLRASRKTDLNVVPELPRSSAGVQIVVTESIRDDEEVFLT